MDQKSISKLHSDIVSYVTNYEPPKSPIDDLWQHIIDSKRTLVLASGRSLKAGEELNKYAVELGMNSSAMNDSSFPLTFKETDFVLGISGSGTTPNVVSAMERAYTSQAYLGLITTTENSLAADIIKKSGGMILIIPGNHKNSETSDSNGISLAGGFELRTRLLLNTICGSKYRDVPFSKYYEDICKELINYSPSFEDSVGAFALLPEPSSEYRMRIMGEGIGKIGGNFAGIRMGQLSNRNKGQERRVEVDDTNPRTKEGDIILGIDPYGDGFFYEQVCSEKEGGAKLIAITAFENSPLALVADHAIIVPGGYALKNGGGT